MKKKILSLLLVSLFVIMGLCACGPGEKALNAYDTDSIILGNSNHYMYKNKSSTTRNGMCKCTFGYFCGVDTLGTVEIGVNALTASVKQPKTFDIDMNIEEGKLKFVLVKGDQIFLICDETFKGEKTVECDSGKWKLKVVGYDCKGSFYIKY